MQTENDYEDSNMTGGLIAPETDAPAQMPLGIGDEGFGELPLDLGSMKKPNTGKTQSVLVMLLVLVVAGGTLWTMRVTGGVEAVDGSVSVAEQKIEQALARLKSEKNISPLDKNHLNALFGDTEQVVAIFEDDPTKRQVQVDQLQKNPFELVVTEKKGDQTLSVAAIDRVKTERVKELKNELSKMQLQSLLNGATPLAVISGKVVRAGDHVGSFDVIGIGPDSVKLSAEGNSFTLTMKRPTDKLR